jgi:hypothetical protein
MQISMSIKNILRWMCWFDMYKLKRPFNLLLSGLILVFVPHSAGAQAVPPAAGSWIRVHTDDRTFSIEVPAAYKYYANEEGFSISHEHTGFDLRRMQMLNAYLDRSTLSFEVYKANRRAVAAIYEADIYKQDDLDKSEFKLGDVTVRQVVRRNDKYFYVRQYFASRGYIYVLTAISRDKETPAVTRFLRSMQVALSNGELDVKDATPLSQLQMTDILVEQDMTPSPPRPIPPKPKPEADDGTLGLIIVSKPRAAYTNKAREKNVVGSNLFRVTLSADAFVPRIVVVGKALPGGLLRQSMFSAIRIKFLPKEKDGVTETVVQAIEYNFSIY